MCRPQERALHARVLPFLSLKCPCLFTCLAQPLAPSKLWSMACSTCPGSPAPQARPTSVSRAGMRVRVNSAAEVAALVKANPGYAVSQTQLGPMNILVVLTPRVKLA